jgi:hemolysin D
MLDAVVKHVSADVQERPEPGNPAIKPVQQAAYRVLISLGSGHLVSQGRQLHLVPGMQVNAEIHLGTRSVLEYLLSPVQKITHETGRER